MTDWTAIVREAEADLAVAGRDVEIARAVVEEAQAAYQAARDRQAQMRSTVEWARRKEEAEEPASTLARASNAASAPESAAGSVEAPGAKTVAEPSTKTLVDRCTEALERFGRPVKTAEIRDLINREGHDVSTSQVGSTLKYLSERRKPALVERLGDGVWRLAEPPSPRGHSDAALNGAGRSS